MSASSPRVAIASDHAGVAVKAELVQFLASIGLTPVDLGPASTESVDYPGLRTCWHATWWPVSPTGAF
jgi:ribose 5-phosphate isomerase B